MAAKTDWASYAYEGCPGSDFSGNNSSGFEGLPAGFRENSSRFYGQGEWCLWWSATSNSDWNAWPREIVTAQNTILKDPWWYKSSGLSVRCLKD